MMRQIRSGLTFANVTSVVALFVALGGSSYAALQLPKGSVGPQQLKRNSVTSPKVKPGSLLLSDFKASERARLRGLRGTQGPQGAQGPQGPQGVQGVKGDRGESGATTVVRRSANGPLVPNGNIGTVTASCNPGERATGGGWSFLQGTFLATLVETSQPLVDANGVPNGWHLRYWNNGGGVNLQLTAYVICALP